jgi:hypothetical protein
MTRRHIPYSHTHHNDKITHTKEDAYTQNKITHTNTQTRTKTLNRRQKNKNVKNKSKCDNKNKPQILKYKNSPINDYYISIRYRLSIPKHATNIENGK